jgi:hypothetical protein
LRIFSIFLNIVYFFLDKECSTGKLRSSDQLTSFYLPELAMFNKVILSVLLVTSNAVFAASATNSAAIVDGEKIVALDISINNWAIVANNTVNGKTKFREFYDMGNLGVQQIDYVVSCPDQKLSLAGFKVLTTMSSKSDDAGTKNIADLSYYTPVIQHDINIVSKVCGDEMLTRSAKANN